MSSCDKNFKNYLSYRIEPQVLDYQTQQYRLFSGLATCYSIVFASQNFRNLLIKTQEETNNLRTASKNDLAKVEDLLSCFINFMF